MRLDIVYKIYSLHIALKIKIKSNQIKPVSLKNCSSSLKIDSGP